jgi:PAS domain S-box-containing protein
MPENLAVLLVEDSESDAEMTIRMLKKADYQVVFERVETAEEMKVALSKQAWDLVISDYNLPQFGGYAALEIFKSMERRDAPFIVVSGAMGEETAVAMMKAGAHDYLMKDNLARLAPAVARELEQAQGRRERKRAEEALRVNEALYRQAIMAAGAVPYYRDYRDPDNQTYTIMGEGIVSLTGYSATEITPEIFDKIEKECVMQGSLAHLTVEEAGRLSDSGLIRHWACDYHILTRSGQTRWISDAAVQVRDENDRRIGVIGILQDITDRKQTETQLKEQIDELRRWHQVTVGREDRIIALKREVNELLEKAGMPPRYSTAEAE